MRYSAVVGSPTYYAYVCTKLMLISLIHPYGRVRPSHNLCIERGSSVDIHQSMTPNDDLIHNQTYPILSIVLENSLALFGFLLLSVYCF